MSALYMSVGTANDESEVWKSKDTRTKIIERSAYLNDGPTGNDQISLCQAVEMAVD